MNVPVILAMIMLLAQTTLVHMIVNATLAILETDIIAQVSQYANNFYGHILNTVAYQHVESYKLIASFYFLTFSVSE